MLRRRARKNQARILDEPKPAIEGWIAQEDAACGALGLKLNQSCSNKRATDALALMSRGDRNRPQAEPTERLARDLHWRRCNMPDNIASDLGHEGNGECMCVSKGQNNEMLSLATGRMIGKGLPRDGINGCDVRVTFASDGELRHLPVA